MAQRTESSITVAAPPVDVLAVIADVEQYPEWASGITAVDVLERCADTRPGLARFTMSSGPIRDTLLLRYEWATEPAGTGTVTWSLTEPGSVTTTLDGAYELAAGGAGTSVTYRLTVEIGIPMPGLLRRRAEKAIIDAALKDLKARVESRAGEATVEE